MEPLRPDEAKLFLQARFEGLTVQQILQRERAKEAEEMVSLAELEQRFVDGHGSLVESVAAAVEENRSRA